MIEFTIQIFSRGGTAQWEGVFLNLEEIHTRAGKSSHLIPASSVEAAEEISESVLQVGGDI